MVHHLLLLFLSFRAFIDPSGAEGVRGLTPLYIGGNSQKSHEENEAKCLTDHYCSISVLQPGRPLLYATCCLCGTEALGKIQGVGYRCRWFALLCTLRLPNKVPNIL